MLELILVFCGGRFGKFTQLQFDGDFRMSGSGCTTYLLEKSRVVGHEPGERAYHIFYQARGGGGGDGGGVFRLRFMHDGVFVCWCPCPWRCFILLSASLRHSVVHMYIYVFDGQRRSRQWKT